MNAFRVVTALTIVASSGLVGHRALLRAQEVGYTQGVQQEGVEALNYGPVHEAFAEPVVSEPQAPPVVQQEPPQPVDEQPPDVKPADALWIPGYWEWNEDRAEFIWVSGTWRVPPVGQRWVPGYWTSVDGGYQRVPGFWTDDDLQQVTYLPQPPASLEEGPNSPQPNDNCFWTPGHWEYRQTGYGWSPGYWAVSQPDRVWVAPRYFWSPGGYIYCAGHWDVPLVNRGWLFSPVAFSGFSQRYFTPTVVVNPLSLWGNLFVSPTRYSYYFGDYYGRRYYDRGFVPWYQYGRRQYDPIFTYENWHRSRKNNDWWRNLDRDYRTRSGDFDRGRRSLANANLTMPLSQYVRNQNVRFDRVSANDRQRYSDWASQVQSLERARGMREKRADSKTWRLPEFANARQYSDRQDRLPDRRPPNRVRESDTNRRTTNPSVVQPFDRRQSPDRQVAEPRDDRARSGRSVDGRGPSPLTDRSRDEQRFRRDQTDSRVGIDSRFNREVDRQRMDGDGRRLPPALSATPNADNARMPERDRRPNVTPESIRARNQSERREVLRPVTPSRQPGQVEPQRRGVPGRPSERSFTPPAREIRPDTTRGPDRQSRQAEAARRAAAERESVRRRAQPTGVERESNRQQRSRPDASRAPDRDRQERSRADATRSRDPRGPDQDAKKRDRSDQPNRGKSAKQRDKN